MTEVQLLWCCTRHVGTKHLDAQWEYMFGILKGLKAGEMHILKRFPDIHLRVLYCKHKAPVAPTYSAPPHGGRSGVRNTPATYFKHLYRLQNIYPRRSLQIERPLPALATSSMGGVRIPAGLFGCPPVSLRRVTALLHCHVIFILNVFCVNTIQQKTSTPYETAEACAP